MDVDQISTSSPGAGPRTVSRRMPAARVILALACCCLLVLGACVGLAALIGAWEVHPHTALARGQPIDVPISVLGKAGTSPGVLPVVRIRIDGGPAIPVLLDTGATGLHVLARAVPSELPSLGVSESTTWGDGSVTDETLEQAQISIGGLKTTHPVPIGVVNSVGCRARSCPAWAGTGSGIAGTLGVSLRPGAPTTNPLFSLPEPYNTAWRISLSRSNSVLELGAPVPARPTARFQIPWSVPGTTALQPSWPTSTLGSPYATGAPTACWQIGKLANFTCLPTQFDSGSTDIVAMGAGAAYLSGNRALAPGAQVSLWQSARSTRPLWSLTSGETISADVVRFSPGRVAVMVAGIPAFYAFKVTFDARQRQLLLTPNAAHREPSSSPTADTAWKQTATDLCTTFAHTADRTIAAQQAGNTYPTLSDKDQALADEYDTWAHASLRLDRRLLRLKPPTTLLHPWQHTIAGDVTGSKLMLQFASKLASYRTRTAYQRAAGKFHTDYTAAERRWEAGIAELQITGCN